MSVLTAYKELFLVLALAILSILYFSQSSNTDRSIDVVNLDQSVDQNSAWQLEIPKIQVLAPIVFAQSDEEDYLQHALNNGVVHYPNTAPFGKPGNAYLIGHSSDFGFSSGSYKQVFKDLDLLATGDQIIVRGNRTYNYVVMQKRIVDPADLTVLDQNTAPEILLSLQTSYPVGTQKMRLVIIAKLHYNESE